MVKWFCFLFCRTDSDDLKILLNSIQGLSENIDQDSLSSYKVASLLISW